MDIDRKQRTDIDTITNDRLTLAIDESNIEDNPYVHETIKGMEGNNWVNEGTEYVKYNLVEDDNLILIYDPITKLSQKSINKVTVSFDYVLSNNINRPILDNISLVADSTYHEIVNYELNNSGHIDIDCEIFGIDEVVLNTIISIQGFGIGLNFNGKYSNATIRISNVKVSFKYSDKLYDESGSVINRLEPYIDFYRDDDGDLILQIGGDATGKGMDRGGTIDTYSKTEIDNKLATKVDTQIGKGLSSNDYTNAEKTKLSGIAENANYYIHPFTHDSSIIVNSDALTNLDTSANASQSAINAAIDGAIGDKQDKLTSGENIKTINNESVLGSGNITIQGGSNVDIVTSWGSTTSDSKVPSEKLAKNSLDDKISKSSTSGLVKNDGSIDTTTYSTFSGSYNDLSNKPTIPANVSDLNNDSGFITSSSLPTKTSDLQNDGDGTNAFLTQHQSLSNYIQKSNTNGLLKNDGSVDTTSYSTFSGSYNDLSNKPTIPSKISDLTNDSDFIEKSNTSGLVKNDGSIDTTSYLSSLPSHNHDDRYYTETEMDTALSGKQATLVSGTNIKTINNTSLLGSGNISIQGGGSVTVDSALSTTSENPVQNKVITGALNGKANSSHTHTKNQITDFPTLSSVATSGSYNDLSNKPSIPTKTSDLTNDGSSSSDSLVYVETSATNGLLKSDGSVDTNSYIKDTELIPINSDLNDYNKTGFYACNLSSTDLQTLQNCPVTDGFSLLVEENKTFNNNGYKQTLTTWGRNGKPQVYIRTYAYDDMYSNPAQTITSGWQLWYEDTGWQDMAFPTGFGHYSTNQKAQYRRIGKIVHLRGAVKNTNAFTSSNDTSNHIATISDTTCRPSAQNEVSIQQGSGQNRFLLTIDTNGKLYCARYGTTSNTQVNASAWLNINCTFMVE